MAISSEPLEVKHLKMPHVNATREECAVEQIFMTAVPEVGHFINGRQILSVSWESKFLVYMPVIWSKPPHDHDWFSMNNGFELCKGCSTARIEGEEKTISTKGSV